MKNLSLTIKNNIAVMQFVRHEALNALNTSTFDELNTCIEELSKNSEAAALIITGSGKSFVAGADIAEMQHMDSKAAEAFSEYGQRTFSRLVNFPKPVIAAVNGYAFGGGLELALACDFIIASASASFSAPELKLGLIPGFCGTQRLSRQVGFATARFLIFTAKRISADEALRIKLVQEIAEDEKLLERCSEYADVMLKCGPYALAKSKQVINYGIDHSLDEGAIFERLEFSKLFDGQGKEGMNAFLEKRTPKW
jgi:enoyl-CoA hydratase